MEAEISNVKVLWAQKKRFVYLKVEAKNLDQSDCKIEMLAPNIVKLAGKNKLNNFMYHMNLELWHDIWLEKSKYTLTDNCVKFNITKKWRKVGFWPRLLKQEGKFRFLAVDWERWQDPEYIDPKNLLGENIDLEDFDDLSQDSDSEGEDIPEHLKKSEKVKLNTLTPSEGVKPGEEESKEVTKAEKEEAKAENEESSSEEDYVPEHLR